ncbi:PAS domain-containing protein [Phreatobacter sp.]|uniref:PAS domain-containing protein n=1 Tax=Phreatobacter sp. TaxID=1966341 RepID=UPI003F728AA6
MRHDESRHLFSYWDGLRAGRAAPDRTEVDPRDIATILGDTFILEADRTVVLPYRLAGSRVSNLFAGELKGSGFLDRFSAGGRERATTALADATAAQTGLMLALDATSSQGRKVDLEAVILPLVHRGRIGARLIGTLSVHEAPWWIGRDGIASLDVTELRLLWPTWQDAGRESPAAANGAARPRLAALVTTAPARPAAERPLLRLIRGGLPA